MALGDGDMKAEEIAPITMPGRNLEQHPGHTRKRHKSFAVDKPAETDSEIITPSLDRIRFSKMEAANSQTQQIAQQIRQVNQSMETIASHLSEMRAKLEHIVKIYPPYPPGSSERIEALRQFSALRKMIDQVIQPTGDDSMTNILSAPDGSPGFADLDISADASDEQISDALDRIAVAQANLQAGHHRFVADANRIISELR
jgi:uncharacterized protein YukE